MKQESVTPSPGLSYSESGFQQQGFQNVQYGVKRESMTPPLEVSETEIKQESVTPPLGVSETEIKQESVTPPPEFPHVKMEVKPKREEGVKHEVDLESVPLRSSSPGTILGEVLQDRPPRAEFREQMGVQPLVKANILVTYGPATKRLLLLDYDGTLTDIVAIPDNALLGEPVLEELEKLASNPKNAVWIISGRDRDFLAREPGRINEVGLVAEHGAFVRYPRSQDWLDMRGDVDMSWRDRIETVMQRYVAQYPGSTIERKTASLVWHFRNAKLVSGSPVEHLTAELEEVLGSNEPVEVKSGKCIIEARLKFINKGHIAQELVQEINPDFVLCAGDDITDEDMFKALHSSDVPSETVFTVVVGKRGPPTCAQWYIDEPVDLIGNIYMLTECDRSGKTTGGSQWSAVPHSYLIRANR